MAMVLISDVKDEFVGVDLRTAQLNYFYQGITGHHLKVKATVPFDSFEDFHAYEVDWTPDAIIWYVDRTVAQKADTYNAITTWPVHVLPNYFLFINVSMARWCLNERTGYQAWASARSEGDESSIYVNASETNISVMITSENTVLNWFETTGTNIPAPASLTQAEAVHLVVALARIAMVQRPVGSLKV
ncbi:CAZyme family GH16 [Paecilomyces variotii]|nr:CAZyme family GH16 [Paecilomyces variotii]